MQSVKAKIVVNCFQNCIFTYDSQQDSETRIHNKCCELLSELYFYLWFPTAAAELQLEKSLWIAFRIVFLLMIPNKLFVLLLTASVVNCFQNCIFTYDSQPPSFAESNWGVVNCFQNCIFTYDSQHLYSDYYQPACCELLSELYFYLWFPTSFFGFMLQK